MADHDCLLTRTMVKVYRWAIAKKSGNGERFNKNLGWVSISGLTSESGTQIILFDEQTC